MESRAMGMDADGPTDLAALLGQTTTPDSVLPGHLVIALERKRQVDEEGYDAAHDEGHTRQLILAAEAYALAAHCVHENDRTLLTLLPVPPVMWPWAKEDWKPAATAERNLAKAGALLAAAIDSLPGHG